MNYIAGQHKENLSYMELKIIKLSRIRACIVVLVFLTVGILVWSTLRSYRDPVVTEVTIESSKVTNPVRYVFIADLHENIFGENNQPLYNQLKELDPDFILIGGDLINWTTADGRPYAKDVIENLSKISNVYYSLGNHEIEYLKKRNEIEYTNNDRDNSAFKLIEKDDGGFLATIRNAGGTVLQKTWTDIEVNGTKIRIGAAYEDMYSLDEDNPSLTMQSGMYSFLSNFQNTEALKLYLAHRPSSFLNGNGSSLFDIDVVMSGHEHGGQVVLPFVGGLFSRERGFFPNYTDGSFMIRDTMFIVTSGLGSDDELLPRVNNPPEIFWVTIQ